MNGTMPVFVYGISRIGCDLRDILIEPDDYTPSLSGRITDGIDLGIHALHTARRRR